MSAADRDGRRVELVPLALDERGAAQDDELARLQIGGLAKRGGLLGVEDEALLRQTKILACGADDPPDAEVEHA